MSDAPEAQGTFEDGMQAIRERAKDLERAPFVTLTTAAEMMQTAISFGAGIYNDGRVDQCYALYSEAARLIVDAASAQDLSPRTQEMFEDAVRALSRAEARAASGDDDKAAWMMRHFFDKTIVQQQLASEIVQWMMKLGESSFMRGDYGGSVDALRTAVRAAHDVIAPDQPDAGMQVPHLAMFYLGNGLILTEQFLEAAKVLHDAMVLSPQIAQVDFDLRQLGPHYASFAAQLEALEQLETDDADLQHASRFLRAYLYMFSGQQQRASELLVMHLGISRDDEAAQIMLAMSASGDLEA